MMTFGDYTAQCLFLETFRELSHADNPREVINACPELFESKPCLVGSLMDLWDEFCGREFTRENTPVLLPPRLQDLLDE